MTPGDLERFLPFMMAGFGVAILITYRNTENMRSRLFWLALVALVGIALSGVRSFMKNPTPMTDWAAFGSLFQAIFNTAVAAVLLLRYRLYAHTGSEA